mgnify:CR=1 FL=1
MGFCCISNAGSCNKLFNYKYKYKRIACVDFDVHWGNGNYDVMRDIKIHYIFLLTNILFIQEGGQKKIRETLTTL